MSVVTCAGDFLYALTAMTTVLAVTHVIPRPRWSRGAAWRARHPQ